jgi:hypothetical protein
MSKNVIILLVSIVGVLVLGGSLLWAITAGPLRSAGSLCEEKAIIKGQEKMEQTEYPLAKQTLTTKPLSLKVERWGGVLYSALDHNPSTCEAVMQYREKTSYSPAEEGAQVALGFEQNGQFQKLVSMHLNLTARASRDTDQVYDFEGLMRDLAKRYTIQKKGNEQQLELKYQPARSEEDTFSQLRGSYEVYKVNDQMVVKGQQSRFPTLVSPDNGATWEVGK